MKILHTATAAGPSSFGLGPVILNLVREQSALQHDTVVWSLDSQEDRAVAAGSAQISADMINTFVRSWPFALGYSRAMERAALQTAGEPVSVVHQHGIWSGISRVSNILRDKRKVPIILTPHGSLQAWALKKSALKKKVALFAYEQANIDGASCFHAVSHGELGDIRTLGIKTPVAVIPNGISDSWLMSEGDAARFRQRYGVCDKRILLFLSRVTPKKGLPMLLQAIKSIGPGFSEWVLVIAGTDEFGHLREVEEEVSRLGLNRSVIFTGGIFGSDKRDAFAAAECFVLPSYSEGAPIVILEALAAGVPVIATEASPWKELNSAGAGRITEISASSIAEALAELCSVNKDKLAAMGANGRRIVSENYNWRRSAGMTIQLYSWLVGRGSRPDFVDIG